MRRIAGISLAAALLCAACDTSSKLSFDDNITPVSIRELKEQHRGTSTLITHELSIEGVVTANDIRGEFPRMIILEDATAGIEISADHPALADLFPLGSNVRVSCSGLALGEYGGKVRLGARPTGSYSIDRIPRTDIPRYLRCTELNAYKRRPYMRRIPELAFSNADTYIRLEGVRFEEAGAAWCDRDPETATPITTQRTLTDADGNRLPVRIAAESHYATEPIPAGIGSVNGIVDYFNGELSLRIINYEIVFSTSEASPTTYPSIAGYSVPIPTK